MNDNQGMIRWLTACRHDIAHLHGWTDADNKAWVEANLAEGHSLFDETYQARSLLGAADEPDPNDGLTPIEAAIAAVKVWAQTV